MAQRIIASYRACLPRHGPETRDVETLRPYVQPPARLFRRGTGSMWGSDWPVLEQVSTLWVLVPDVTRDLLKDAGETALAQIFGDTAHEFYRLSS